MILEDFRETTKTGGWRSRALVLLSDPTPQPTLVEQFGTYWIEGGHDIREQIADDHVLVCLLRHMLPAYSGGALTLFRGENIERWEAGHVGLAWTTDIEVARMFGRGLNSLSSGGVLLRGLFEAAAIISPPNAHSRYLGEDQYTIDLCSSVAITAVETFPPTL